MTYKKTLFLFLLSCIFSIDVSNVSADPLPDNSSNQKVLDEQKQRIEKEAYSIHDQLKAANRATALIEPFPYAGGPMFFLGLMLFSGTLISAVSDNIPLGVVTSPLWAVALGLGLSPILFPLHDRINQRRYQGEKIISAHSEKLTQLKRQLELVAILDNGKEVDEKLDELGRQVRAEQLRFEIEVADIEKPSENPSYWRHKGSAMSLSLQKNISETRQRLFQKKNNLPESAFIVLKEPPEKPRWQRIRSCGQLLSSMMGG